MNVVWEILELAARSCTFSLASGCGEVQDVLGISG